MKTLPVTYVQSPWSVGLSPALDLQRVNLDDGSAYTDDSSVSPSVETAGNNTDCLARAFGVASPYDARDIDRRVQKFNKRVGAFVNKLQRAYGRDTDDVAILTGRSIVPKLPFHNEMLDKARKLHGIEDVTQALNYFLRGELGRDPYHAEVMALRSHLIQGDTGPFAIFDPRSYGLLRLTRNIFEERDLWETHPPIFQIYTKEYLDAYGLYILKLVFRFREKFGREPNIAEIAAGDGRFARALNARLARFGANVVASDSGKLRIRGAVIQMDAVDAAKEADIILANWLHPDDHIDGRVAEVLRDNPQKTFIVTGDLGMSSSGEILEPGRFALIAETPEALNFGVIDGKRTDLNLSQLDFNNGTLPNFPKGHTNVWVFRSQRILD